MTETDSRRIGLGVVLLAVSTVLIFGRGTLDVGIPIAVMALATLGLAAGALLVGTASSGRPV